MSAAAADPDAWNQQTHIGSYGYMAYDGKPADYRFGPMLFLDDIGSISYESLLRSQVGDLTAAAKTGPNKTVAAAFNQAIIDRRTLFDQDGKITAYAALPFAVRFSARFYMLKGDGSSRDDSKSTPAVVRKQAAAIRVDNYAMRTPDDLRKQIAAFIRRFDSTATISAPIQLSDANIDDYITVECLTGRTHLVVGLAPVQSVAAYRKTAVAKK